MATIDSSVPTTYPGKGLGIAGFIVSFFFSLVGLILSIVAYVKSRKAGFKNGFALAGIIIGAVFTVLGAILFSLIVAGLFAISAKCEELGPGTHYEGSTTITCGTDGSFSGTNS